jgi:WD40 repeat protein
MPDSRSLTLGGTGHAGNRASPYVGLSFYTEADADFFFGRDAERQVIMGNLRASRLTLLYAESGVGKSSLLRAGAAARLDELARMKLATGDAMQVPVVFSSWKDDPIEALINQIGQTANSYLDDAAAVELDRHSLAEAIKAAVNAIDRSDSQVSGRDADWDGEDAGHDRMASRLLVILDQFEEYFLYSSREHREQRFADQLADAINRSDVNANFLISIREDAYSALGDLLRGRISNVYGNYLHLEYLDSNSAREAIEKPIAHYNDLHPGAAIGIESGLVDVLLDEVRRQDVACEHGSNGNSTPSPPETYRDRQIITPYLQLVMTTLWERELTSGSRVLRRSTLEELHGARQIVASHLDTALCGLTNAERDVAIDSLHHLVTPSGTKIALEVGDLAAYTRHPVDQVGAVLQKLAGDARVLRTVPPAPGKSPDEPASKRFEIYHDVLADPINRSVNARALRSERRRAARLRRIAAGAVALALFAALGLIAALLARRAEISAKKDAQSRQIAAGAERQVQSNPELASLLALKAMSTSPTPLAKAALRDALPQLQLQRTLRLASPVTRGAFSPDGKLIVTATADGVAHLWDAHRHARVGRLGVPGLTNLFDVTFSPDGKRILAAYGDGTARLWDVASHHQLGQVMNSPYGGAILSAAFSPDGRELVIAGNDGTATTWNARTRKQVGSELDADYAASFTGVAFSPNGRFIATSSSSGKAVIWSSRTHRAVGRPLHARNVSAMYSVAFSPDSQLLVTAASGGRAMIWSTGTRKRVAVLNTGDSNAVADARFSSSGKQIVTAELDGKVRIWQAPRPGGAPSSWTLVRVPTGPAATSTVDARFDRSGQQLLTSAADGTAALWNARTGKQEGMLQSDGADVGQGVAFSPDGQWVAAGTYDGVVSVWRSADGRPYLHLQLPHGAGVTHVAFSGGGRYLVAAGDDGSAYVIKRGSGSFLQQIGLPFDAYQAALVSAEFDPGNPSLLMTAGQDDANTPDSQIRFWRLRANGTSGQSERTVTDPHHAQITDAQFSPTGDRFVTSDADGYVDVWSSRTRTLIGSAIREPASMHAQLTMNSAAFSHDGRLVVTANEDGTVRIWDALKSDHPLVDTFAEPLGNALLQARFGAGDATVIASSRDGHVYVWDRESHRQMLALMGHSGAVHGISVSKDGREVATAGSDGTARIWSLLPVEQVGPMMSVPDNRDVVTASFSPDSRFIALASDGGTAQLRYSKPPYRTAALLNEPGRSSVSSVAFSQSGRFVVTADDEGTAVVWGSPSHSRFATLRDPANAPLSSALLSPGDRWLVSAGSSGAQLWKASRAGTFKRSRLLDSPHLLRWAAFSADGRYVVTAEESAAVKVWEVSSGKQMFATLTEPGHEAISGAWFSPHDVIIAGHRYPRDHIIVTSSDDGTATIWDLTSAKALRVFEEPGRSSVYNAVISPDGTRVLTASQDGTARIWSVSSPDPLTTFNAGDPLSDAEFSPDAGRVVTAGQYGVARVFSTQLAGPIESLVAWAHQHLTRTLRSSELKANALGG